MANGVSSLHYMEIINYRFMCRKGRLGTCSMAAERAVRGGNQTSHWGIRRGTKRVMGTLLRLQIFVLDGSYLPRPRSMVGCIDAVLITVEDLEVYDMYIDLKAGSKAEVTTGCKGFGASHHVKSSEQVEAGPHGDQGGRIG